MGWRINHTDTSRPPRVRWPVRIPLATATVPAGTFKANEKVALSLGWSFDGKMSCARSGWADIALPSGVMKNATLSSAGVGTAVKRARTTNRSWRWSGRDGVITSSSPAHVQGTARPSTVTSPTLSPAKSRLKRDSACVARATIVTRPSIGCVGALVA